MTVENCYETIKEFFTGAGTLGNFLPWFLPPGHEANATGKFLTLLYGKSGGLDENDVKRLQSSIEVIKKVTLDDLQRKLRFPEDDLALVPPAEQFRHRLLAILYGGLAVSAIPKNPDDAPKENFIEWTNACGKHFDQAWFFHTNDTRTGRTEKDSLDEVAPATRRLIGGRSDWGDWYSHHNTRLVVRRLLAFLHGDEPLNATDSLADATAAMLLTSGDGGTVRQLRIAAHAEFGAGWYFDPVLMGTTIFDDAMQTSIELAGRLSRDELLKKEPQPWAIRLSTRLQADHYITCLQGDSAGGLVACSIHALANDSKLTAGVTASISLNTSARCLNQS